VSGGRFQPSAFGDSRGSVSDSIRQLIGKALEFPVSHRKPRVKGVRTPFLLFAGCDDGASVRVIYSCGVWRTHGAGAWSKVCEHLPPHWSRTRGVDTDEA
jgi:hypothetical protein